MIRKSGVHAYSSVESLLNRTQVAGTTSSALKELRSETKIAPRWSRFNSIALVRGCRWLLPIPDLGRY
jgi:hypothetical protein